MPRVSLDACHLCLMWSNCLHVSSLPALPVPMCALQKLQRKRVLGSGPYGAVKGAYSADKQEIITAFKVRPVTPTFTAQQASMHICWTRVHACVCMQDGSFFVWSAKAFKLARSFTLPVAHMLRSMQQTFALSPDGQLLVSGGSSPLLLVFNVVSGIFLYALRLPGVPSGTGAQQVHFMPDSAVVAGAGVCLRCRPCIKFFPSVASGAKLSCDDTQSIHCACWHICAWLASACCSAVPGWCHPVH